MKKDPHRGHEILRRSLGTGWAIVAFNNAPNDVRFHLVNSDGGVDTQISLELVQTLIGLHEIEH